MKYVLVLISMLHTPPIIEYGKAFDNLEDCNQSKQRAVLLMDKLNRKFDFECRTI